MGLFTESSSVTPFITLVSTTFQGIINQMILIFILLWECKISYLWTIHLMLTINQLLYNYKYKFNFTYKESYKKIKQYEDPAQVWILWPTNIQWINNTILHASKGQLNSITIFQTHPYLILWSQLLGAHTQPSTQPPIFCLVHHHSLLVTHP
jgi:hypothetical protein